MPFLAVLCTLPISSQDPCPAVNIPVRNDMRNAAVDSIGNRKVMIKQVAVSYYYNYEYRTLLSVSCEFSYIVANEIFKRRACNSLRSWKGIRLACTRHSQWILSPVHTIFLLLYRAEIATEIRSMLSNNPVMSALRMK